MFAGLSLNSGVRMKQMPKGRKVTDFTELRWYKEEIDECMRKIRDNFEK